MLDERKKKVLQAVIDDYVTMAEPVGSRTVARTHDLGVSAATIRNEMADLEMLGYLEHIHTSSGRIPSSKGYRFYVDDLLTPRKLSEEEKTLIDRWYKARVKRIDEVFQETAKIISHVTKNLSFVLAPQLSQAAFRCLQFLPLDEHRAIAVVMTDAGFIENRIVKIPDGAAFEDFQRMAKVINECLAGKNLAAIQPEHMKRIRDEIGDEKLYESATGIIRQSLDSEKRERLYLGGTTEALSQPEFHSVERMKEILLMLEEKQLLKDILHAHLGEGLSVTIGRENKYTGIQDCSIITATYHLDGELLGTIAVLGPTRMEYGKAMTLLGYMNDNLASVIRQFRW
ncbi:MAG: heat-inducible transcriptional repressor HrcA [Veillonellaceae bacterium]|nr:heat-inducible transcriptional repressor HrcA [Veillonellaceae bacterium]